MIPHTWNLIKHTNLWLKLSELKHRIVYPHRYYRQREAMERFRNCKTKKPAKVIRQEIRKAKKFWGCYPLYYFRYDLYREDRSLTEKELVSYIPEFFFHRHLLDPYYDNKYCILVDQKCLTALTFAARSIPQPEVLGTFMNGVVFDRHNDPVTPDQWITDIEVLGFDRILIKPTGGRGGKGIYFFEKIKDRYTNPDGYPFSAAFIESIISEDDFLVQEGIVQHPEIAKIYPDSVNTFRMVTENLNENCRLTAVVMRIGHDGSFVDNFSHDGIVLGINKETGQANETAKTERDVIYTHHPNTGYRFSQFTVPDWPSIKEQVLSYSRKLAMIPYIGWDIALTEAGPVALEANSGLGPDLTQMGVGGLRDTFGIDDPKKYWKLTPQYRVAQYEKYAKQ